MNNEKFDRVLSELGGARKDTSRLERGFETRTMARIRAYRERQPAFFFMAWRMAPALIMLFIATSAWLHVSGTDMDIDAIAATNAHHDGIKLVSYMSGE